MIVARAQEGGVPSACNLADTRNSVYGSQFGLRRVLVCLPQAMGTCAVGGASSLSLTQLTVGAMRQGTDFYLVVTTSCDHVGN